MKIGDRVTFIHRHPHSHPVDDRPYSAYWRDWPYRRGGEVVAQPYRGVFSVRVDGYPLSRVPVTEDMVRIEATQALAGTEPAERRRST